ncbi:MAG: PBSX family phage terminase large subunit [Chloroflexi bacterium]|nr:MAG: PBSX family phage terminase large subunit [Chloroflexota bacterium]
MALEALDGARAIRRKNLVKAMMVKAGGLDSDNEVVRQKAASEIIEWELGKADQPLTGKDGEPHSLIIPADLIAPDFFASHRAIHSGKYNEFVEDGGRGSTKSSFISVEIIELLVNHPTWHALATRQVKDTLRDSVYAQFVWAIEQLGLTDSFKCTTSPLEIEYLPTGQKIYFRGADDPGKIKSIKPPFGYIAVLWFEELDSFRGPEVVRNIEQSAIRGGDEAFIFKSFNPPRTSNNWANKYIKTLGEKTWHHSSNYLNVPIEWLGKAFIDRAEYLKAVNPPAYEHEYLGVVNGLGGTVFENAVSRTITDEEIAQFDHIGQGIDWGYYPDPFAWGRSHYDPARHKLYVFDEYRAQKMGNEAVYKELEKAGRLHPGELIIADSAEPKSIGDFRAYGANIRGAEKGPDSRGYSYKWLQSLAEIVIDPVRAPFHLEEFLNCEYEQDKDGNYISEYPEHDDHFIDEVRYRTNLIWRMRGQ